MNINMPQVGDVWTNRTGKRHFVITNISQDPKMGNDWYDIVCTEVGTGKVRKGTFSTYGKMFHFHIRGGGATNNHGNYYHSAWTARQMAGDLIPPGYRLQDVLTEAMRERLAHAEDKANGGARLPRT